MWIGTRYDGYVRVFRHDDADSSSLTDDNVDAILEGPEGKLCISNDTDQYAADNRTAWHGRALVVIRSLHMPGEIKLTVTLQDLPDAFLNINVLK